MSEQPTGTDTQNCRASVPAHPPPHPPGSLLREQPSCLQSRQSHNDHPPQGPSHLISPGRPEVGANSLSLPRHQVRPPPHPSPFSSPLLLSSPFFFLSIKTTFPCGSVRVSRPLSPFVSPSPYPPSVTMSVSLPSMSASPLLPCK